MRRIRCTAWLAGLISLLVLSHAGAEEKLESGKDRIDVPAIGAGLCLHNRALLGPAMGVCDGMRISGDSHGGAMFSYESAAARWFYNRRVWLNDPDAIVCRRYGESKGVEWSRCWMSWMALAGNVLTYGDTFDDLPAEYVDLYRRVLPPLPVVGRPLDLWENEPYLLWGMDPGTADGAYTEPDQRKMKHTN